MYLYFETNFYSISDFATWFARKHASAKNLQIFNKFLLSDLWKNRHLNSSWLEIAHYFLISACFRSNIYEEILWELVNGWKLLNIFQKNPSKCMTGFWIHLFTDQKIRGNFLMYLTKRICKFSVKIKYEIFT